jgi:hypothetical protein
MMMAYSLQHVNAINLNLDELVVAEKLTACEWCFKKKEAKREVRGETPRRGRIAKFGCLKTQ